MFERSIAATASGDAKETNPPKKTFSGFLPLFSCKSLSEAGNAEGGTPSSGESLPFCSFYSIKPSNPTTSGRLKETKSCPSLLNSYSLASPCSPIQPLRETPSCLHPSSRWTPCSVRRDCSLNTSSPCRDEARFDSPLSKAPSQATLCARSGCAWCVWKG